MFRFAVARSRSRPLLLPRAAAALSSASSAAAEAAAAAGAGAEAAAPRRWGWSLLKFGAFTGAGAEAAAAAGAGAAAAAPPPVAPRGWGWSLLKFGVSAGALGSVGYVTHAYTLTEVGDETLEFRVEMTTPPHIEEDATQFEKFLAMALAHAKKVPVLGIEFYLDMRKAIESHLTELEPKLLPDLPPEKKGTLTLVLDLNETLVYSDWQRDRGWITSKRPGADAFLQHMAKHYEVVVYSDQLQIYVDPVIDRLDKECCIMYRLSRPATKYKNGKHYRDLSKLNRNPEHVIYISAHALESCLQLENCVDIKPWKLETDDTHLLDLIPFLEYLASVGPVDVRRVLASFQGQDIPKEFANRVKGVGRQTPERKSIWRR